MLGRTLGAIGVTVALAPSVVDSNQPGSVGIGSRPEPSELDTSSGMLSLVAQSSAMILVTRSTFGMGSTPDEAVRAVAECHRLTPGHRCNPTEFADEMPMHRVTLSAYWLDRMEVTVAEYARCTAVSRCNPLPLGEGARRFDRPSYPASLVTWADARDYCAFRGARLPTEAEFERAARGPSRRTYPWGDLYNSRVSNHGRYDFADPLARAGGNPTDSRDGFTELAPVGSFPEGRTPDGFLDLAGNVAEWVGDPYTTQYDQADAEDPGLHAPPPASQPIPNQPNGARIVRGGSYETGPLSLRGAAREPVPPNLRRPSIGFRCARSAAGRGD